MRELTTMNKILTSTFAPTAMANIQLGKNAPATIAFAASRNLPARAYRSGC